METRCRNCNMPLEYGYNFCRNCGTPINNTPPAYNNVGQTNPYTSGYGQAAPMYPNNGYAQPQDAPNPYATPGYGQPNTTYQQNTYQQPYAPQPVYQQPVNSNPYGAYAPVSKKEFAKNYATKKNRKGIKSAIVIGYICAILSLLVNIGTLIALEEEITLGTFAYLAVYVGIILGCTIGLQNTYNKYFALGVLLMAGIDCVLTLILYQQFSGWLVLASGISAFQACINIDKEYNQYLASQGQAQRYY